jgi:hypothetical protein
MYYTTKAGAHGNINVYPLIIIKVKTENKRTIKQVE